MKKTFKGEDLFIAVHSLNQIKNRKFSLPVAIRIVKLGRKLNDEIIAINEAIEGKPVDLKDINKLDVEVEFIPFRLFDFDLEEGIEPGILNGLIPFIEEDSKHSENNE